jgi:hypothetical protein
LLQLVTFEYCSKNDADSFENPLYVDPFSYDFSKNPLLLERILSGPHGYFRFINIPFSQLVCLRFENSAIGTASLNLHGDAHLEQYAVTDLGRGLTDYDDSSTGPAIIDWMRFGVSLHFACLANGWQDYSDSLFNEFLSGYRTALDNPDCLTPEPAAAERIKSSFVIDREKYFQWLDSIMEPMPEGEVDSLLVAMVPYKESIINDPKYSSVTADFFEVVKIGYSHFGIGSALDQKYLIRVRGFSDSPLDDVVLECKEVRDLSGIDCIKKGLPNDPLRILLGQSRIAYQPFEYLGYFYFRDLTFWVHSWVDHYIELNINESFLSLDELREIVYDVGVQLGKGHVKDISTPLDFQLRFEQKRILERCEEEIKKARHDLALLTIEAWEKFKEAYYAGNTPE